MKLVIDIPEERYELMKEKSMFGRVDVWKDAIRNGTPLPKGHGDLVDRKEMLDAPYKNGGFVEWYNVIKYAPTIIEADKEEQE